MNKHYIFVDTFEMYKERVSLMPVQFARLKKECDTYLGLEVPRQHPAKSITFMGLYIFNLSLMYRLTGEKAYLFCALSWMDAVIGYEHWGNDSKTSDIDLSASWVLWGLSLGYDWLNEYISPERNASIRAKIFKQAQILYGYKKKTEGHGWSTEYWQNHNWINMTGLATAGYALGKEGRVFVEDARENFTKVFALLADDGSNYEGCAYWRYGGMWLFLYAALAKCEENLDFFISSSYMKNTFYYRLYQSAGDLSQQLNFGDTHDRHSGHPACVYYLFAREYRDGYAQHLGNLVITEFLEDEASLSKVHPGILPEAGLEYLWFDPTLGEKDFSDLPLTRFFPDLGLVCIRDGWNRDSKVFSFKCGYPGGKKQWLAAWNMNPHESNHFMSLGHNHPDNLSYILEIGSRFFTCEDGYNRAILPIHHNVLLVDGLLTDTAGVSDVYLQSCYTRFATQKDFDPRKDYFGKIEYYASREGITFFCGENSRLYPPQLHMKRVSRFVLTDTLHFVLFMDLFESETQHQYQIICNTDEPGTDIGNFTYHYPSTDISYKVLSDKQIYSFHDAHSVKSIMTPQEPDTFCEVMMNSLCHVSKEKVFEQRFIEMFSFGKDDFQIESSEDEIQIITQSIKYTILFFPKYVHYGIENNSPVICIVEKSGTRTIYEVEAQNDFS